MCVIEIWAHRGGGLQRRTTILHDGWKTKSLLKSGKTDPRPSVACTKSAKKDSIPPAATVQAKVHYQTQKRMWEVLTILAKNGSQLLADPNLADRF